MAVGTAGIGGTGKCLPIAAFPVLADQKFTVFSIDSQKIFSAARTFLSGDVFMTEGSVCCFDLGDEFFRVAPDTGKEGFLLQLASGDFSKLQFPGSCQLRLFRSSGTSFKSCLALDVM